MNDRFFLSLFCFIISSGFEEFAIAKLTVVASTADISAIVTVVGGDRINLRTIAEGTYDPHSLTPRPSYVLKLSNADLLVSNGLSLESEWLPTLIEKSKNLKISIESRGYLELGNAIDRIGSSNNSTNTIHQGHPEGNPHFTLDPISLGKAAISLGLRLAELDPENKTLYAKNASTFQKHLEQMTTKWKARILKSGVSKAISYHSSFDYFLKRFGIEIIGIMEPSEGIPPSASHLANIISLATTQRVPIILVENYSSTKSAERVAAKIKNIRILHVTPSVNSDEETHTNESIIEKLVQAIESAQK